MHAFGFVFALALWVDGPLPPVAPQSAWLTEAMRDTASLTASTKAASADWKITAETTNYQKTGAYKETVDFYNRLAKTSPYARVIRFGQTSEGRPLLLLIASKDRAFTPEAARRTRKPVILLQNGIHAGENGGKDAAMMLLRDILITGRHRAVLDKAIVLSIAVFNADGHERVSPYNRINENGPAEMGFRVTALRLNLNRDYIKADAPEMQAWLWMYHQWLPELTIDNHVTDGSDIQNDVTFGTHMSLDTEPSAADWTRNTYIPGLFRALEKDGHVPGWYTEGRGPGPQALAFFSPRFSTGYCAARNRPALLVETHSLKPFRTRIWSHYDIMHRTLELIAANPGALVAAVRKADETAAAHAPGEALLLSGRPSGNGQLYTLRLLEMERYRGSAAGADVVRYIDKPQNVETSILLDLEPATTIKLPRGWLVPMARADLMDRLKLHGIRVEPVPPGATARIEQYRFNEVKFAPQPFEGRFQVIGFQTKAELTQLANLNGMSFVPLAQPGARLAAHLLEPEAPDSLLRWGYFHSIFEQKEYFSEYVFEPIAEEMLRIDAALKAEFDSRVQSDSTFAKDRRARLMWLFRRSPYFEPGKDIYPVYRVIERSW